MVEVRNVNTERTERVKGGMRDFPEGTLCLLQLDISREAADGSGNLEILKCGSPVKIIGYHESALSDEDDGSEEDFSVVAELEDHIGGRWQIEDVDVIKYYLLKLDTKKAEWLVSDKSDKKFKKQALWSRHNTVIRLFCWMFLLGAAMVLKNFSVLAGGIALVASFIYLVFVFVKALDFPVHDFSEAEYKFFENYKDAKEELTALMRK